MDRWTSLTEFFACGLFVLPAILGIGLDDFEVFAVTLGLMQLLLIAVTLGAPTVAAPSDKVNERHRR
ncbi:MAG: hypothetical protein H6R14_2432 [Proteobacteria bacterium]|nr:hypothetical protein [Pseudomonadota bacterium]